MFLYFLKKHVFGVKFVKFWGEKMLLMCGLDCKKEVTKWGEKTCNFYESEKCKKTRFCTKKCFYIFVFFEFFKKVKKSGKIQ